ncbi:MAG: hypothetical protein A2428_15500 [Bdellovibrionales bacterium RIFOXYC1_FULL_54_43]|nr:MAG: hypothetical protein A2428_15500 [Bdellovibrionales bacterium RIFOXYC1_FULL_54_43]OFZ84772.1 MAG: hypothetical protein A2603_05320 [Bdellovibrionales bacterium RIFOXYD1_FULL_55_31]HLE01298.1 helix-turn-helix domain-containing protein [Bdellovibrionota bacterium]
MDILKLATDRENGNESVSDLTWLDSKDAAKYLRRSVNALRILTYRGYIKPRKLGRRLYFRRIELDRMIESSLTY